MKKIIMLVACLMLVGAAAQAEAMRNIKVTSGPYQWQTEVRPARTTEGLAGSPAGLREFVASGVAAVTADVSGSEPASASRYDIGFFDAEIVVRGDKVEVSLGMRHSDDTSSRVKTELNLPLGGAGTVAPKTAESFSARFADLVSGEAENLKATHGEDFAEAVSGFAGRYAQGILKETPRLVEQLRAQEGKLAATVTGGGERTAPPAAAALRAGEPKDVRREGYEYKEGLKFGLADFEGKDRTVPVYRGRSRFLLSALAENNVDRYRLAEIGYTAETLPTPTGLRRTTFAVEINYLMGGSLRTAQTFTHDANIEAQAFFSQWKGMFWKNAVDLFLESAADAKDRTQRRIFLTYLEPYVLQEYYEFAPFLLKAAINFDKPSTAKELKKLAKQPR
ncbi:MAG: hypothetical protein Q8R76_11510 [Candidatus Omnitrophota bacterium]|nr:hypothetical protein [Candidatus Omnitrophota bacterium]